MEAIKKTGWKRKFPTCFLSGIHIKGRKVPTLGNGVPFKFQFIRNWLRGAGGHILLELHLLPLLLGNKHLAGDVYKRQEWAGPRTGK